MNQNSNTLPNIPPPVWKSSYASAILAVILVIELVGISIDTYFLAKRWTDPNFLGQKAEAAIRENYPEIHQQLLTTVKAKAPELAEQASQELIAAIPDARQELEQLTARQIDAGLTKLTQLSAEEFRELLDNNRETIIAAFQQVEQAPEEAREIVLQAEARLDEQLGVDIRRQAKTVLAIHRQLNDKLARLTDPQGELDPKEQIELRIVRILKTMGQDELQLSQAGASQSGRLIGRAGR